MIDTEIVFETHPEVDIQELVAFYRRQHHPAAGADKLRRMADQTFCFVTARRRDGELIGIARGVTDGLVGYLAECKLDPACQGPACVTRTKGRIEHDEAGIAREMARRVVDELMRSGVDRIHVLAYGTEVDFCEEMGFRRVTGMVPLELCAADRRGGMAPVVGKQAPA